MWEAGHIVSFERVPETGIHGTSSLYLQFCTFGSRLVSPGCYVFSRRLDRFCSALSSMLERHLSSHMWK